MSVLTSDPAAALPVRTVPLKFRLGEIALVTVSSRLRVCDRHFSHLGADPEATLASLGPVEAGVHGTLLRSHPIPGSLPRVSRTGDAIRYVPSQYERCFTALDGTFVAYLKDNFSSKSRSTLKRKVKKFAKESGGELEWRAYRTPEEWDVFFPLARELSGRTYQERLLDVGLPDTDAFRAEGRAAAEAGNLRAYLLFLGGRPAAYLYCPVEDGVSMYHYLGHDPELNRLSPGTVLQYVAFEELFADPGVTMFDFTEGEGQHKRFFATGSVRCADVYYFERTLRNRLLVRAHRAFDAFSNVLTRLLDRLGLKQRLKRWLRRR